MPRFYFHFVAKTLVPDDTGTPLPDTSAAIAHAEKVARALARKPLLAGCAIIVADEEDQLLAEIPLPSTNAAMED